ncbi:phospholipase D-like domain-containing protein [Mucilaginibacter sp. dw_454]|uniref:phospholipase D-like domain-containing protein n=1 Tax=Mucilaginibacter sp. dw_454 TaxID=2720079 RepID=UPI001BD3CC62|nr:phospholipase D-like domain-containing protein [Mucilaginibacter sp. dw_454]
MTKVLVTPYLSPTLVLLAFDWADGFQSKDFLGFAIKRTPGFKPKAGGNAAGSSWLPNRLGFNGPNPDGGDMPSNTNPIQHFEWWDANIRTEDRGQNFEYDVYPVTGTFDNLQTVDAAMTTIKVTIPETEEKGIGTYFNRAVVSSQAFSVEFGNITTHQQYVDALSWLSNGMDQALLDFISKAKGIGMAGASYHLTDNQWVIPALQNYNADASFIYFYKAPSQATGKGGDNANAKTLQTLKANNKIKFYVRTKTNIMHDKFIVRTKGDGDGDAEAVLTGTANFTTEGLTQQANVIHTFESPDLAALYLERQILLRTDPDVSKTAAGAAWSKEIIMEDAALRVFFAPEQPAAKKGDPLSGSRQSIDAVVNAVKNAKSSVMFSLFSATDKPLLDACLAVADGGKLMRGLVNSISKEDPAAKGDQAENASTVAATWLYERSKDDNMVVGHDSFSTKDTPAGFLPETSVLTDPSLPKPKTSGSDFIPPVFVHQKIVIIDGTTDSPTIYVGSANLSGNSTWHNDENLLEITKCPRLGKAYVAEFMRLYEQYRARYAWNASHPDGNATKQTFSLTKDTSWAAKDYKAGTMEFLARKVFTGQDI